jgi:hypothetical protein
LLPTIHTAEHEQEIAREKEERVSKEMVKVMLQKPMHSSRATQKTHPQAFAEKLRTSAEKMPRVA